MASATVRDALPLPPMRYMTPAPAALRLRSAQLSAAMPARRARAGAGGRVCHQDVGRVCSTALEAPQLQQQRGRGGGPVWFGWGDASLCALYALPQTSALRPPSNHAKCYFKNQTCI